MYGIEELIALAAEKKGIGCASDCRAAAKMQN